VPSGFSGRPFTLSDAVTDRPASPESGRDSGLATPLSPRPRRPVFVAQNRSNNDDKELVVVRVRIA